MTKVDKEKGFIKTIILLVVIVATLAYFNIDVGSVISSEPVQAVWSFTKTLFTNYISPAVEYVWDNILRDFIFENVVDFFNKAEDQISNGNINDIINSATTTLNIN